MRSGTRLPGSGSARSARPARLRVARGPGPEASPRAGRAKGLPCDSRRGLQAVPPARLRKGTRWALAPFLLVSPVPRSQRLPNACFARLLRTFASRPFHLAVWQTPPLPFLIGKRADRMAHKRESRPTRPRTHLDALSCSRARDFWPPNLVLARNPPHLKGKGCSRTTKAQIGRISAGQSTPKGRRSVPERGLVARNRRFPCTRDNRRSAPPSPFGKLGAPANSTSALSRPFRHLPAATRKGRSVRRGLPPSPPASRRGAAQRKAGGCETGGPSTAALRAGHSRCRTPPAARVAVRARFRRRRCAFLAPYPQGIKPRPPVGKHGSD